MHQEGKACSHPGESKKQEKEKRRQLDEQKERACPEPSRFKTATR